MEGSREMWLGRTAPGRGQADSKQRELEQSMWASMFKCDASSDCPL